MMNKRDFAQALLPIVNYALMAHVSSRAKRPPSSVPDFTVSTPSRPSLSTPPTPGPLSSENWMKWTPKENKLLGRLQSGIISASKEYGIHPEVLASIWATETSGVDPKEPPGFHIDKKDGKPHYSFENGKLKSGGPFQLTPPAIVHAYSPILGDEERLAAGGEAAAHILRGRKHKLTDDIYSFVKPTTDIPEYAAHTAARFLYHLAHRQQITLPPREVIMSYNGGVAGRRDAEEYVDKFERHHSTGDLLGQRLGRTPVQSPPINAPLARKGGLSQPWFTFAMWPSGHMIKGEK